MTDLKNTVITEGEAEDLGLASKGDCFSRAVENMFELPMFKENEPVGLRLCHGLPRSTNPHPALVGRPFHHAWVEFRTTEGGDVYVVDEAPVTEEDLEMVRAKLSAVGIEGEAAEQVIKKLPTKLLILDQDDYYEAGEIEEEKVRHYTPAEALRMMAAHLHYGPWEDLSTNTVQD